MPKLDPESLRRLAETPEGDHAARHPDELTPAEKFIARIKGMLVGDEFLYAEGILRGILRTVEQSGRVSEGQRRAIDNIEAKPFANEHGGRNRRWGGW